VSTTKRFFSSFFSATYASLKKKIEVECLRAGSPLGFAEVWPVERRPNPRVPKKVKKAPKMSGKEAPRSRAKRAL
jgi:hypothetical protein